MFLKGLFIWAADFTEDYCVQQTTVPITLETKWSIEDSVADCILCERAFKNNNAQNLSWLTCSKIHEDGVHRHAVLKLIKVCSNGYLHHSMTCWAANHLNHLPILQDDLDAAVGIKRSKILSKRGQSTNYFKVTFSLLPNICATFERQFVANTFQK